MTDIAVNCFTCKKEREFGTRCNCKVTKRRFGEMTELEKLEFGKRMCGCDHPRREHGAMGNCWACLYTDIACKCHRFHDPGWTWIIHPHRFSWMKQRAYILQDLKRSFGDKK